MAGGERGSGGRPPPTADGILLDAGFQRRRIGGEDALEQYRVAVDGEVRIYVRLREGPRAASRVVGYLVSHRVQDGSPLAIDLEAIRIRLHPDRFVLGGAPAFRVPQGCR